MQQLRAFHVFQLRQYAHHVLYVMSVKGPEITNVHALKDILLVADSTLDCIVQTDNALASFFVQITFGVQPLRRLEAQFIIGSVRVKVQKVAFHAPNGTVN